MSFNLLYLFRTCIIGFSMKIKKTVSLNNFFFSPLHFIQSKVVLEPWRSDLWRKAEESSQTVKLAGFYIDIGPEVLTIRQSPLLWRRGKRASEGCATKLTLKDRALWFSLASSAQENFKDFFQQELNLW